MLDNIWNVANNAIMCPCMINIIMTEELCMETGKWNRMANVWLKRSAWVFTVWVFFYCFALVRICCFFFLFFFRIYCRFFSPVVKYRFLQTCVSMFFYLLAFLTLLTLVALGVQPPTLCWKIFNNFILNNPFHEFPDHS